MEGMLRNIAFQVIRGGFVNGGSEVGFDGIAGVDERRDLA